MHTKDEAKLMIKYDTAQIATGMQIKLKNIDKIPDIVKLYGSNTDYTTNDISNNISNQLSKRWTPNWFTDKELDLIAYKELREDSNDVDYHDLKHKSFVTSVSGIPSDTITNIDSSGTKQVHGYKDVIPVYFSTNNYGYNDNASKQFFKKNNISYKTQYYLKPTGKDIFTIHTFYPNDDNAVVFKYIPPDDNSFIRLIVLNNSYRYSG